ncbi:MAG: mycofactocin biosynthesis peptidyl-dipeptidase MftE [Actinomycetota bacterium]|nr:mycofactocin biosynthesis peptidyl-dipeptidase MftE [Actinomycetota bacterium]
MLGDLTWPEAGELAPRRTLVIPVGSTEQHGPHLPLCTDTLVVEALCRALADSCPESVVVAPTIAIGASDEHHGFAGTLSVGTEALSASLQALAVSASSFARTLFATTHGGNLPAMRQAAAALEAKGAACLWWWPGPGPSHLVRPGDLHAGWLETSLMLHLAPELVRLPLASPGPAPGGDKLMAMLASQGVAAYSANGVIGDPEGADAETGRAAFAAMLSDLREVIETGRGRDGG